MLGGITAYAISESEVKFENEFRRLWIDHVLWTRNYITSATTAGVEDQKEVLARLLKNQEDIGNMEKKLGTSLPNCLKSILLLQERLLMQLRAEMKLW